MYLAYRWISRELGKFETICSILIISLLIGFVVNKSLQLFSLTERRLVEASVSNIKVALQLQAAIQSLGDIAGKIEITEGMNPLDLMQSVPDDYDEYIGSALVSVRAKQFSVKPLTNYLGEFTDPDINLLERGNWYFDRHDNALVYLIKQSDYFGSTATNFRELRYSVQLDYTDMDNNGHYDARIDQLKSATLVYIVMNG